MIKKSSSTLLSAGVFTAIAASLCCITPVIALIAGSSSIAASFSWIEPTRPYLIGLSIAVLAFAWFLKIGVAKANEVDCNCEAEKTSSFFQSKGFLGIVTVFAVLMMAFPLYAKVFYSHPKVQAAIVAASENKQQVKFIIQGMTCQGCEEHINKELAKVKGVIAYQTSYATGSSLVSFDKSKVQVTAIANAINKIGYKVKGYNFITASNSEVSFYKAPLVCAADPAIGCGSKAKFLLADLEQNVNAVSGAWMNRKGTVVAIKWNSNLESNKKREIVYTASTRHNIKFGEVTGIDSTNYSKNFPDSSEWLMSKQVDQLSKEEAAFIAQKTIEGYKKMGLIKPFFEKQFKNDIQQIYTDLFLSISSYKDLNIESYNKIENKIQQAGEKYVGKGKMPHVELCTSTNDISEKDKFSTEENSNSCGSSSSMSCCKKN